MPLYRRPSTGSGISTIQDESTPVTQRSTLNFVSRGMRVDLTGTEFDVSAINHKKMSYVYDDFVSIGTGLGWLSLGTLAASTATQGRPGIVQLSTSTLGYLALAPSATAAVTLRSGAFFDVLFIMSLNGTTSITGRCGLALNPSAQNASGTANEMICFERLSADATWFSVTKTSTTAPTRTNTTVAAAGFHKFRIRRTSSTNIEFSVDGTVRSNHTTNVPADATFLTPFFQVVSASGTRGIFIDYFDLITAPLTR